MPLSHRAAEEQSEQQALLARAWSALPASYRIPDVPPTLSEARAWCKHLAETHYENFHVASWFLPEALRPHFHAIYAYCRVSDDLGDEVGNTRQSLALLDFWGRELDACYEGRARHPVFVALAETIRVCNIPKEPFADLLTAFRQDQVVTRYATMDEVLHYCRYSANPVGRLVLYACGYSDEERFRLSDATCSALQLANFWQDVRVDFAKDRVYIPQDDMQSFGVTDSTIQQGIAVPEFRALLKHEVDFARSLFKQGLPSSTWSIAILPSISISSAAAASKSSTPSSARTMMCSAPALPFPNEPSSTGTSRCERKISTVSTPGRIKG